MKRFKIILVMLALFSFGLSQAAVEFRDPEALRTELQELLKNHEFQLDKEVIADVTFTINKNNEVVVLSVETDQDFARSYVVDRLNYKKLQSLPANDLDEYKMLVRIKP